MTWRRDFLVHNEDMDEGNSIITLERCKRRESSSECDKGDTGHLIQTPNGPKYGYLFSAFLEQKGASVPCEYDGYLVRWRAKTSWLGSKTRPVLPARSYELRPLHLIKERQRRVADEEADRQYAQLTSHQLLPSYQRKSSSHGLLAGSSNLHHHSLFFASYHSTQRC